MPKTDEDRRTALALALRHAAQAQKIPEFAPLIRLAAGFLDPDTAQLQPYRDAFDLWEEAHGEGGE